MSGNCMPSHSEEYIRRWYASTHLGLACIMSLFPPWGKLVYICNHEVHFHSVTLVMFGLHMESATTTEIFYEIWWCRCWQVQACQVTAGIPHHNPPSALLWAREPFIRLGSQKAELTTRRAAVTVPFSNRKEKFCSFTIVVKELLVQLQPDVLH